MGMEQPRRSPVQELASESKRLEPEKQAVEPANASVYCPVCFRRLEQHRCKLICNACGYYMSCSDYY
ncbi:MAG: hypothetical protein WBE20_15890 [Candidatus Acidiferrales bacterium]